ncbi:tetratricopeptide repeat protein [uncultured Polaribacter sp.]|uniref:tetratricopeptide repeat protein n=1 Tax=uncultured Polaribacter sp. TaxID=174711 RepID=UPI00262E3E9B|nr:tetratricopeptide repeat protein [uncultured Polaribacter sp.]
MKKFVFLMLFIITSISAQEVDSLFVSANNYYKNGDYKNAIEAYKNIASKELVSSELFYNLGNAYYKINKVGPAIYYYEKGLKLNPLQEDIKNNLVFAKRLALDNIEALPKTIFQKININYLQKLSYNQWAIVVVVVSFFTSLLFLLFYFASSPAKKRGYFTFSILSLLLLLTTVSITYNQYGFSKNNIEAIVFSTKTEVRNAPTLNAEEVFTLHEGAKVFVLDAIDNWKKIKLADGKVGWIIADEIKEI